MAKGLEKTEAEVGKELRLEVKKSPYQQMRVLMKAGSDHYEFTLSVARWRTKHGTATENIGYSSLPDTT